jgi:excisionase family DNA binding protein
MKIKLVQLQNMTAEEFKEELVNGIQVKLDTFLQNIKENKPPKYIDRKEAGKTLGVSTVTIDTWGKKGILKRYTIGNQVRFKRSEIEQVLENSATQ